MADLRWDEVEDLFWDDGNMLPDVTIADTTAADWQAVLDLIRSKGWAYQYSKGRLPTIEQILEQNSDELVDLKVWPVPEVLAIFRFYSVEAIDFDVALRELQGQDRLDVLCAFFRAIGHRLGKPVVMTFEGSQAAPMIGYDNTLDRVVRLAPPQLRTE
jgi:hypothetical protein